MGPYKITTSADNTIVIANENTTIGYATFDVEAEELTYIFVNPAFRRKGYGSVLLQEANDAVGKALKPADPISPLGEKFFASIV
jgi:GNAT superfamily N-acetyltransferase